MKPERFALFIVAALFLWLGLSVPVTAAEVEKYTVKQGDTLYDISERFYGDRDLWPKLWEMNKSNMTNPHRLTVGDVLYLYPLDRETGRAPFPPTPPAPAVESHYDRGHPLDVEFPKYFTFVADPKGIAYSGINRIKVKKTDPLTGQTAINYDEVRDVGMVIASEETGYVPDSADLKSREDFHGRLLLSFNDNVIVRFTEDVGRILDAESHEDPDPYFREFPIYGLAKGIRSFNPERFDNGKMIGQLHQFKGLLTIVSRIETSAPLNSSERRDLSDTTKRGQDAEPVSYVARITYSERTVQIGDRVFLFKSMYPGPDRETGRNVFHELGQSNPSQP